MVVKRDGRREVFSKDKLLSGVRKACEKRPVSADTIEKLVDLVVESVTEKYEREIPGRAIGEKVMDQLGKTDHVAYVRFASVYRRFQEATEFVSEVKKLETFK